MAYIHSGTLLSLKNELKPSICENIGRPREHNATWNKADRERQTPYDLT